jgi:2-polyprenyl-3-methyl-5-hydroxy-6-metoxy-1,4-benzoquinol methylase
MPDQMPNPAAEPSPLLFFDTVNAYQRTAAIRAAIELDLFTALGEGAGTAQELAQRRDTSERGMRILCDYLTLNSFLTKEGNRYRLTPDSAAFLDRRSPAYLGGAIGFLLSPMLADNFKELTAAVRKGGTTTSAEGTMEPEHPIWVQFARAMAPLMMLPAQLLAKLAKADPARKLRVLDIAAGHGVFGIAFAQLYLQAEVTAVDWPNVLEVAQENAKAAGVSARHRTLPGSAFEVEYGEGYDIALLTNFLHHFDPPTCEKLLSKVHAALAPGGRAMTLEFIPNEDRISPAGPAAFSLIMLASTPSGDAYTFAEFERMFQHAGFSRSEFHPLPPTMQQVVISHK